MHSFIVTEPHAHSHAVRRGGWQESAWLVLFTVKALTVWLVRHPPNRSGPLLVIEYSMLPWMGCLSLLC